MMTRLLDLTLVFAVMMAAPARKPTPQNKRHAEAPIIWSGNKLYDLCQHYKTDKLSGSLGPACFTYISGVAETLILNDDTETLMIPPCPGERVTEEQIVDVVIKWMEDHPEKRDLPAPFIVMKALTEAFPCK